MPDLTHDQLCDFADMALLAVRDAVRGDVGLAGNHASALADELEPYAEATGAEGAEYSQFDLAIAQLCTITQNLVTAMKHQHDGDSAGARSMLRGMPAELRVVASYLRAHQGRAEMLGGIRQRTVDVETDSSIEWAMEDSLERLLQREIGDGFVVFENPESGCFVQFARVIEDEIPVLLLDVPHLQVDDEEKQKKLMAILNESRGAIEEEPEAINFNLSQDAPHAAAVAHRIMQEVYELGDWYELRMEEH